MGGGNWLAEGNLPRLFLPLYCIAQIYSSVTPLPPGDAAANLWGGGNTTGTEGNLPELQFSYPLTPPEMPPQIYGGG